MKCARLWFDADVYYIFCMRAEILSALAEQAIGNHAVPVSDASPPVSVTMRVELIGHFKPCMTEIYLHSVARMADCMATHP